MPDADPHLRYVAHIEQRGCDFYRAACTDDLEGIVATWKLGTYQQGRGTSWLKIKNQTYSQMEPRHELFEARRAATPARRTKPPTLMLA